MIQRSHWSWRRRIVALAAVLLGLLPAAPLPGAEPALIVGVFPRYNFAETQEMFQPLVKHLARELGRSVKLETTRDFASFWTNVAARRYHVVHLNQVQYALAHREHGYRVVAKNEEQGESTLASVIVVRKDSGLRDLAALKGRRIMFAGDRSATMSYLIPRDMLRAAGLSPGSYAEEFALNPPNALHAVYLRRADAGGVGESVLRQQARLGEIKLDELAVIARSASVPQLPWAVRGDLAPPLQARIRDALLDLGKSPQGQQILQRARLTGLTAATEHEYEPFQRMAQDGRAP